MATIASPTPSATQVGSDLSIAAGQTNGASICLGGHELVGIVVKTTPAGSSLNIFVSDDDKTYYPLVDQAGSAQSFTSIAKGNAIGLKADTRAIVGRFQYLLLQSNQTETNGLTITAVRL